MTVLHGVLEGKAAFMQSTIDVLVSGCMNGSTCEAVEAVGKGRKWQFPVKLP